MPDPVLVPAPSSSQEGAPKAWSEGDAGLLGASDAGGIDRESLRGFELVEGFTRLPEAFYTRLRPTPLPDPYLVASSRRAAQSIGLDPEVLAEPFGLAVFAGNATPRGGAAHAAVYSGHQFGVWAGQLGDGRAITLGEVQSGTGAIEIQLKGAGLTPYSRMGDGRAVLRSSIREFLASEAMAALGIPTTRALCVIGSDYPVVRESVETAAVVTRLAPSFVRFGSFEHWYHRDRPEELARLADYVIANHFPELSGRSDPYVGLLEEVTRRTARLVAAWQAVGFCHGVMNTDNMSILGLTLDYGPFGFLEAFDAHHICNHSDRDGRYSYARQPQIAHWNLYALGQALLPLIGGVEETKLALEGFAPIYEAEMGARLRAKLGLIGADPADTALIDRLFGLMQQDHPDFTQFFRRLSDWDGADSPGHARVRDLFIDRAGFDAWALDYAARLHQEGRPAAVRQEAMKSVNPKYVLRNYLAEIAIQKAQQKDFSEVARLLRVLEHPFDEQPEHEAYAALPPDWAGGLEVSCSS